MTAKAIERGALGDALWTIPPGRKLPSLEFRDGITRPQILPAVLDAAACNRIVSLARDVPPDMSSGVYRDGARLARSHWLFPDAEWDWLYERVAGLFVQANESFRFEIDRFIDPLLVAFYPSGPGFDWHLDTVTGTTSTRKISLSIPLVPEADYEGGDLEIAPYATDRDARAQGSAVVFPSFLCHRVTPISRGTRAALVAWVHGPAFA